MNDARKGGLVLGRSTRGSGFGQLPSLQIHKSKEIIEIHVLTQLLAKVRIGCTPKIRTSSRASLNLSAICVT